LSSFNLLDSTFLSFVFFFFFVIVSHFIFRIFSQSPFFLLNHITMSDQFGNITISEEPKKRPEPARSIRPRKSTEKPPKKKVPRKPKPKKERKEINWGRFSLILTLIITTLLAIYTGIGFFLVPKLIKTNLSEEIKFSTDLEVEINRVTFNPFSFRVQFHDFLVNEPGGTTNKLPLLQIDHLDINVELSSLLRSRLVCSHLKIDRFRLVITRDKKKKYNFSRFISTSGGDERSDIIEFSKLPFLFSLNNIDITQGEIIFDDRFSSRLHKIEQINLSLPSLANFIHLATPSVPPRFSAIINGSPIELRGENIQHEGTGTDSRTKLSLDINSLDLPLYFDYLPASTPLSLKKGTADGIIQLSFSLGTSKGRQLSIDFDIVSNKIDLQSIDKTLAIQAPTIAFKGSIQPLTGYLHLQELVIQDPAIKIEKEFSQLSLIKLLPFLQVKNPKKRFSRHKRELFIDKLLLDNGTVLLEKAGHVRKWNSVLFNLNKFTSTSRDAKDSMTNGSFSLSAEQSKDGSSFGWKGTLDQTGKMTGDINITSLPASSFFSFLGVEATEATSGKCAIQGQLSLGRGVQKSSPLSYSLKQGTISLANLLLTHNGKEWLQARRLKLTSFNYQNNSCDLGNLFIDNGTATVHSNDLPPILTVFSNNKQYKLHGIDFSGNVTIQDKDNRHQPLKLTELHFQTNNLGNQKKDAENFGLTAVIGRKGELKAQGSLSLQPLQGSVEVSFSHLPVSQVARYYTNVPHILDARASINGQGKLNFPGWRYKGSLGVDKADINQKKNNLHLIWSKGTIGDFLIQRTPFQLKMADISVTKLHLEENKQRWFSAGTFKTNTISEENDQIHLGKLIVKNGAITLNENRFPRIIDSWLTGKETTTRASSIDYSGSLTIKPEKKTFGQIQLTHMRFKADNLEMAAGARDNFSLKTKVNENGSFAAKGDLSLTPLKTSLKGNFSGIQSKHIFPWITEEKILITSNVVFSGKGILTYPRKQFSGFLKASDGRIRKNPDKLLLSWRTADIFNLNVEFDPLRISSTKVNVKQPGFGWSRIPSKENIFQQASSFLKNLLVQDSDTDGGNKQLEKSAELNIEKINIKEGSAQYIDKRLSPAWQTPISHINGTIKTIKTNNPHAKTTFNLTASLAGSPVTAIGSTLLFAPRTTGNSLFKITTTPINLFSEQIAPLLNLDTNLGTFDLVMNSKWIDGTKSGDAHFIFNSLTATSSEADTAVPLALLSDQNNSSQFYVPLDGNEQQSSRPVFNETVNIFQTKLIKAKYSPILLAGHDFSDLININTIQCVVGKKTITDHGRSVMGRYSDLVKSHPKLRLKIIGGIDPEHDRSLLKKELSAKELVRVQEENKHREIKRKEREKKLIRRKQELKTTGKKGAITESNLPLTQPDNLAPISTRVITVSQAALQELGKYRALEVYDQFIAVNGLLPEQLQLSDEVQFNQDGNRVLIKLTARP